MNEEEEFKKRLRTLGSAYGGGCADVGGMKDLQGMAVTTDAPLCAPRWGISG